MSDAVERLRNRLAKGIYRQYYSISIPLNEISAALSHIDALTAERDAAALRELAAKDARIAELEAERDKLVGLVQGWHYLAVGPDEMGDYHTHKQLVKASEPYASPALKAQGGGHE